MLKNKTKKIQVGNIIIGGGAPVSVQTMTKVAIELVKDTVQQIIDIKKAGADLVRCALPSLESVKYFKDVVKNSPLPVVADTHFNWQISVAAIKAGAAKIRINPGNMSLVDLEKIVDCAKDYNIPIRIGGNSGSINHQSENRDTNTALVEETIRWVDKIEKLKFFNLIISLKSYDVKTTININKKISQLVEYPLHLGVTAAGPKEVSLIKSSMALGALLIDNIGDTIRVSMTGDPVQEVLVAKDILRACGKIADKPEIISCPTCGRCRVNLLEWVDKVQSSLLNVKSNIKVAIMGCEVNGPGEAKEADVGIAVTGKKVLLFVKGEKKGFLDYNNAIDCLLAEIEKIINNKE